MLVGWALARRNDCVWLIMPSWDTEWSKICFVLYFPFAHSWLLEGEWLWAFRTVVLPFQVKRRKCTAILEQEENNREGWEETGFPLLLRRWGLGWERPGGRVLWHRWAISTWTAFLPLLWNKFWLEGEITFLDLYFVSSSWVKVTFSIERVLNHRILYVIVVFSRLFLNSYKKKKIQATWFPKITLHSVLLFPFPSLHFFSPFI